MVQAFAIHREHQKNERLAQMRAQLTSVLLRLRRAEEVCVCVCGTNSERQPRPLSSHAAEFSGKSVDRFVPRFTASTGKRRHSDGTLGGCVGLSFA